MHVRFSSLVAKVPVPGVAIDTLFGLASTSDLNGAKASSLSHVLICAHFAHGSKSQHSRRFRLTAS
jgi:hypothetical protein